MITKDTKAASTRTFHLQVFNNDVPNSKAYLNNFSQYSASKEFQDNIIDEGYNLNDIVVDTDFIDIKYETNKTEYQKTIYQIFQSKLKQAILDEELTTVSAASDQQFIEFLNTQHHLKTPAFFVNSFDNIELTWRNVDKEAVDLQFLGDGQVQFVIFSKRFGDKMTRVSGRVSDARVKDMVDFYGLQDLVYEPS